MRVALISLLALGFALAACGDSTSTTNGKKDAAADGVEKDAAPPEDGPAPDGEEPGDGTKPGDGAKDDGTAPTDGTGDGTPPSDAALADYVASDAALADYVASDSALADAPASDAALADAAPSDAALADAVVPSDAALADAVVPSDAALADQQPDIVGQNDILVTEAGVIVGTTACTDGIDNDGDGKIDHLDPECTGPLDNDEATFGTGIPGDNKDCKQDCFFDGNSGGGGGDCVWQTGCDPLDTSGCKAYWTDPVTDPDAPCDDTTNPCPTKYYCRAGTCVSEKDCPDLQTQSCLDNCQIITPNGCDCFGCCTFPLPGGGTISVKLVPTCTTAVLTDPALCPPCTPTTACDNPCGECEICVGKPELPPQCYPDSGVPQGQCPYGWQWCGDGTACPTGTWCLTGCCVPQD